MQLTPVLYGNRLYSQSTYSTNEDAEAFEVDLTDIITIVDPAFDFARLDDFVLINDWIEAKLYRANIWTTISATPVVPVIPLYGQVLYSETQYADNIEVEWAKPSQRTQNWTNENGESHR